jgi:hypothetical protein
MTKKDFDNYMENDGKKLKLNNYYEPLKGRDNSKYKGQWNNDRTQAEGLGILINNGTGLEDYTYQGMFKNNVFNGPGRLIRN